MKSDDLDDYVMTSQWQQHREPLRTTLARTAAIALVLGAIVARWWGGGVARWPLATLLILWFSFGGHWVELWFLNGMRPRLSAAHGAQVVARLAVWFVGGCILALGMYLTAMALTGFPPAQWPAWWLGGLAFIGLELVVHLLLQLRGQPSFYDRRG
jgi:hypothetical protein